MSARSWVAGRGVAVPALRGLHRAAALAGRYRWAGIGLALAVEVAVLLALAAADPATVVGIPAAVTAAIAGTVAVVFGPRDGAVVAAVGAGVFATAGGWGASGLAAVVVWPVIVGAAGIFAQRVSRHRLALQEFVELHELERQRLALELHDETAQTLATALMVLRRAERAATPADAAAATAQLRALLQDTIRRVRALAVYLRPRALDDFGLAVAIERLGDAFAEQTGLDVEVEAAAGTERLPSDVELALYRTVQEALARVAAIPGAGKVTVALARTRAAAAAAVSVEDDGPEPAGAAPGLAGLRDRLALLGGRLTMRELPEGGTAVRAEIPV